MVNGIDGHVLGADEVMVECQDMMLLWHHNVLGGRVVCGVVSS